MSAPADVDLGDAHLERQQRLSYEEALRWAQSGDTAAAESAPAQGATPELQDPSTPPAAQPEPGLVERAAADVGRGALYLPQDIGRGLVQGVKSSASALHDLANLLPDLPGVVYEPGKGVRIASGAEMRAVPDPLQAGAAQLPDIPGSGTTTGSLVTGATQFAVGMAGAGKLKALEYLGSAAPAAKGALAAFAAFDPEQKRLSDLIQEHPALQNPVTDFLSSKPDDSAAMSRAKNALEGVGMGLATDAFLAGLKALRGLRAAKAAAGVTDEAASGALSEAQATQAAVAEKIGDPSAPIVEVRPAAGEGAQAAFDLTPNEMQAVNAYATTEGAMLNRGLRGAPGFGGRPQELTEAERMMAADLDSAIGKSTLRQDMTLFRGTARTDLGSLNPGDVFEEKQFASFSTSESVAQGHAEQGDAFRQIESAEPVLIRLNVKAGTQGLDLSAADISGLSESEVLLPRGSKFRVTGKSTEGGRVVLDVERIGPSILGPATEAPKAAPVPKLDPDQPGEVFVNWGRIQSRDEVKAAVEELAAQRGGNIDVARRGVRTWAATRASASELDAWKVLQDRGVGEALNADQTAAVRELWVRSAQRVLGLARNVASNGGEIDQIAFRQGLAVHNAIQEQVIAARTETARALNAWAIPAGDTAAFAGQWDQLRELAKMGESTTKEIAARVVQAGDAGLARELDGFIEATGAAKTAAAVRQAWYTGLLSSPKTATRTLLGNTTQMLLQIPETKLASYLGQLTGEENVPTGEATQRLFGMIQGYKDAWVASQKSREIFERALDLHVAGDPEAARALLAEDAAELFRPGGVAEAQGGFRPFSAAGVSQVAGRPVEGGAFGPDFWGVDPESIRGRFMSFLDTATTAPTRALQRVDEWAKGMNFNAEIRAQAFRQATEEAAAGKIAPDAIKDRLAEIMASPTASMRLAARAQAEINTFSNRPLNTKMWQAIHGVHQWPVVGDLLLPFDRSAYNIGTQTFSRTPLAPFVKSWVNDIQAGGARGDLAWSKFIVGNGILLTGADLALSGRITGKGPSDPAAKATLQRQGWKPYSFLAGGRYFDLRSLDPIGGLLGLSASTTEILRAKDWLSVDDSDKLEHLVTSTSLAIASQITSPTYMAGLSRFFDAMGDPDRYGERWWEQLISSVVVPRGVADFERSVADPTQRVAWNIVNTLRSQTPGLSDKLPPARDLWGRPVISGTGWSPWYDLLSPLGGSERKSEPADAELERLQKWIAMPEKKISIAGGQLDFTSRPELYTRFVELAGNAAKDRQGRGLLDTMNAIIQGNHEKSALYRRQSDGPDGGKALIFEDYVNLYRDAAKAQLIREHPELRTEIEQKLRQKIELLRPPAPQ